MEKLVRYAFILCCIFICLSVPQGCKKQIDRQKAVDMITARTLGLAYIEEDKLPEAETTFKELISMAPNEPLGYANLGLVYIRMGDYVNAEIQLNKALEIVPHDPEIQLNLAEILFLTNQQEKAIHLLEETLRFNPDHIRTLHKLGQAYNRSAEESHLDRAEELFTKVVDFIPANIAARMDLIELLIRLDKPAAAIQYLDNIKSQMPEFPDQANEFYRKCMTSLAGSDFRSAYTEFNIFRNIMKPTPLYRFGADQLKGVGGPLIGTPVITFRRDIGPALAAPEIILDAIRFNDASEAAGLNQIPALMNDSSSDRKDHYILANADFDGNGTQDLFVSGYSQKEQKGDTYLLENRFGKFTDIAASSGIRHDGRDKFAVFTDFDNDGYLDLYVVNETANFLYYHYEPKKFRNIAGSAGLAGTGEGQSACFADFDHDGDLDLYQCNTGRNQFFRNNLDGTFTEESEKIGVAGMNTPSCRAVFGDFDDDGDLDFFVADPLSENVLYSNLRQGQFQNEAGKWGVDKLHGSGTATAGDFNNDGLPDMFIADTSGGFHFLINTEGTYFVDKKPGKDLETRLQNFTIYDAQFFDFDNDGLLDILLAGESKSITDQNRGLILFHNTGGGEFTDVSSLLPRVIPPVQQLVIADYNEDGDLDIFFSGRNGRIYLYRNDGGNANRYLVVQLVGLRSGSGKNNYFGIGAKVEVKAGDLYQSKIATQPASHFGLGQHNQADVVRVLWTNGVPQNIFEPGSDQALLEKQILKGSCPFLYAWNGVQYEFVTDVLWRSALGMPLGIMAGETAYAFSDPSQDYFKIPGEMLKQKDGKYSIQLTSELWETAYFDQVKLITIDHPESTDIYLDERFTPPPYPPFRIFQAVKKHHPQSVLDDQGRDVSEKVRYKDFEYISNLEPDRYQGVTRTHDLIIDLGEFSNEDSLFLFLNGWTFPTDASINRAVSQSSTVKTHPPSLEIQDEKGGWKTVYENISFPMGKNKYLIIDLSGKFKTKQHRIRIRTTMQIYWDYIFYTLGTQNTELRINTLLPQTADIHYRGFSRMYRKGGPAGPFWFDYSQVSTKPLWRDLVGNYTRYGDVTELLHKADSKYVITNAGDEITLEFQVNSQSDFPAGWSRDFIIYTDGWLKDGDLNTATGQTVEPLPFREMSRYPYGVDEAYPQSEEYQQFLEEYVTRQVSTDEFRHLLLQYTKD